MAKASIPATATKAAGRTLAEFLPLSPAEAQLVAACAAGTEAHIGGARPDGAATDNIVRAELIRFLVLGGEEPGTPIHEHGMQLRGAFVSGKLDLDACIVRHPLGCIRCTFEQSINLFDTRLSSFSLIGSSVPGINGDRLRCDSGFFIREGFRSDGPVRLLGVTIGGNLECRDGHFQASGKAALQCDRSVVHGSVILRDATVRGELRILGSKITGNVEFAGGSFENPGGCALNLDGTEIGDGLFWRHVKGVDGSVNLTAAHVATLVDDMASWSKARMVHLDGFRYDRIIGPCASRERIPWLERHCRPTTDFKPQPWEHLAKTLRDMGHPEQARNVAIAKQWTRRRMHAVGDRTVDGHRVPRRLYHHGLNRLSRVLHWFYGVLAGFGYRPLWTVGWMVAAWLLLAGAFAIGNDRGVFGPSSPVLQTAPGTHRCGAPGDIGTTPWTVCAAVPAAYTTFQPLIYSLDLLLPVVDLQQQDAWSPMVSNAAGETLWWGVALRWALWFEILFGWTTSALLIAVLGKLVDRD